MSNAEPTRQPDSSAPSLEPSLAALVLQTPADADSAVSARELLELALESAEMGWGTWDLETGQTRSDRTICVILGYGEEVGSISSAMWLERIHSDDLERVRTEIEGSLREGRDLDVEYRIIRLDGEVRTIRGKGKFTRQPGGARPRWTGVIWDVTTQHRHDDEVQSLLRTLDQRVQERTRDLEAAYLEVAAARQQFGTVFESNPVPGVIFDLSSGVFIDANPAALEYLDLPREALVGQSPDIPPLDFIKAQPDPDCRIRSMEMAYESPGGRRTMLLSLEPIRIGGDLCRLGTFVDITERKAAEGQVRELASQLTLAEQAERQRISIYLHDNLQQALYAAQVQLAILQGKAARGELTGGAEFGRAQELIRKALESTRRASVDLSPPILRGETLIEALDWLATEMRNEYGLAVTVELLTDWQPLEEGLRILMFQVVRELLFNIVKHAHTAAALVSLQQADGNMVVEVRDGGVGFDAASVLAGETNGSGLSMLRRRMELYDGQVEVTSLPGAGTSVLITIPVAGKLR